MTSLSKFRPWSECNLSGTPYFINHSFNKIFAVVSAFWSLVGNACVKLCETSVTTRTFSRPSEAGSRRVKSTAITSRGLEAKNALTGARTLGCGIFVRMHRWHFFTHSSTSSCIPDQKHLCFNNPTVRSMPWCPISSCTLCSTRSFKHTGNNSCQQLSSEEWSTTRYSNPLRSLIKLHCFRRHFTDLDRDFLSGCTGLFFLSQNLLNSLRTRSLFWNSTSCSLV